MGCSVEKMGLPLETRGTPSEVEGLRRFAPRNDNTCSLVVIASPDAPSGRACALKSPTRHSRFGDGARFGAQAWQSQGFALGFHQSNRGSNGEDAKFS